MSHAAAHAPESGLDFFTRGELEAGAEVCPHAARALAKLRRADTADASSAETAAEAASRTAVSYPSIPRPSIPKWRQALGFWTRPFDLISEARAECGDFFVLELPGKPIAFLCSPEILREVYRFGEEDIVAGEIRSTLLKDMTGDTASIGLDGEEYQRRRKVLAPFLSGQRVARRVPEIRGLVEEVMTDWRAGTTFGLQKSFDQVSRRTILGLLFGSLEGLDELDELARRYLEAFEWRGVQTPALRFEFLGPWSPWARFQKRRRLLMDALRAEVRSRVAAGAFGDDLLSLLWKEYVDEIGPEATETLVVDELVAVLLGGAETTSKALSWTVRGLLSTPHALEALRAEIDEVLGERGIEPEDLRRMPYLDAVVQEGLRHQSVGPFAGPRLVKREIVVGGHRVPAGTVMVQSLHEAGRGELFPEPESFRPERFYSDGIRQRDWVPFGGGLRKCAGMGLALTELATVVATLVQRSKISLGPGSTRPVQAGIAHKPANDLQVVYAGARA